MKLAAHFLKLMTFSGNFFARDKLCLTLFVVANSEETKSTVNTDNVTDVFFLKIFDSLGYGNADSDAAFRRDRLKLTTTLRETLSA